MVDLKQNSAAGSVVEALTSEKVEYVFGLAGSHVLSVFDELLNVPEIRHVVSKNEFSAAVMAGMYGRLTGRPGVALTTAGPGATNAITGIAEAYANSAPLVHISGNVSRKQRNEAFHGVDNPDFLHKMFEDITKRSTIVESVEDIPGILSEAFSLAVSGRPGPVHVSIPVDIINRVDVQIPAYQPSQKIQQKPSRELILRIKDGFARAKNPVICVSGGVLVHQAEKALVTLAETVSAPVFSTADAAGAVSCEHPLFAGGFSPWQQNPLVQELMEKADFILAMGMRSNTQLADLVAKHIPQNTIFIALDELNTLGPVKGVDDVVACDAQLLLTGVMKYSDELKRPMDQNVFALIKAWQDANNNGLAAYLKDLEASDDVHFGKVLHELKNCLGDDVLTVTGVGNHGLWARLVFPAKTPDSFHSEGSWGTMGSELARGIAAKLIYPEKHVVVVTGDGSLLMTGSDYITAVEAGANIIVVVLNDSRYKMITNMQQASFGRSYGDEIGSVDFAKFSECFGGEGIRIEKPEDISKAVSDATALSKSKPILLDVVCNREFKFPRTKELMALGAKK